MIDVETRIRRRTRKSKNNEWQNNGAGKIVQWIKITMKIIIRRMKVMIGIARINLIRNKFNSITVKNGDILLMSVEDKAQLARDEYSDLEHVLVMVTTNFEGDSSDHWYLDTSCSNHMSRRNEWFIDLDEKVKIKVKFGDNSIVIVEGFSKVMIKRKDGVKDCITNVLYVPK